VAETADAVDRSAIRRGWRYFAIAAALCFPALALRFGAKTTVEIETVLFGIGILGSAFLLSWAAEVAQLEISQALAIAFLAFIAVLPEYAVDLVFAWNAGTEDRLLEMTGDTEPFVCGGEAFCRELAIANMTGANRLLIGIGWAAVVLIWWRRSGEKEVRLGERRRIELGFLFLATVWAFTIVIRSHISLIDLIVLLAMFIGYMWHAALEEAEHPVLVGPPVSIAALSKSRRRLVTVALFLFAAGVILASAEPFAHGLVETGKKFNIDEFLLVQWLAPLASEAPEMIIAILFVLRARPAAGLGTLVSSKVNQWSLLIATIPLVYAIANRSLSPMPLDGQQVEEVFLTAAQSAFAVAVLGSLSISRGEAVMLLVPFLGQFAFPISNVRWGFSGFYLLAFAYLILRRRETRAGLTRAVRAALTLPRRDSSNAAGR
jgi:cation:H+ antiporter